MGPWRASLTTEQNRLAFLTEPRGLVRELAGLVTETQSLLREPLCTGSLPERGAALLGP